MISMDKHQRCKLLQGPTLTVYILLLASALAARPGWVTAGEAERSFRIEILAGNGKPGDIPEGGEKATEIPVDLPLWSGERFRRGLVHNHGRQPSRAAA